MPAEFPYDVFLSHNAADKPRVRRLAERLRAAGLRVWFDEWIIQPVGSPRPADGRGVRGEGLAIERGLEASRTLGLCLSPAALGSDWVGLERSTVLFRDPATRSWLSARPRRLPSSFLRLTKKRNEFPTSRPTDFGKADCFGGVRGWGAAHR
jgi:hypothetical protein